MCHIESCHFCWTSAVFDWKQKQYFAYRLLFCWTEICIDVTFFKLIVSVLLHMAREQNLSETKLNKQTIVKSNINSDQYKTNHSRTKQRHEPRKSCIQKVLCNHIYEFFLKCYQMRQHDSNGIFHFGLMTET